MRFIVRVALALVGVKTDPDAHVLAPEELFLSDEAFFTAAKSYGRLALAGKNGDLGGKLPNVAVDRRSEDPLARNNFV